MARREQWRPDSAFSGGAGAGGFLAAGQILATLSGAVASGELCTQFESGAILRTNPYLPWSAINNNVPGAVGQSNWGLSIGATATSLQCSNGHPKKLYNGNIVYPAQLTAQFSGTNGFIIVSPVGTIVRAATQVSSDGYNKSVPTILPLSTGFVYIWNTASAVKFRLYDVNGNALASAVTVTSSLAVTSNDTFRGECVLPVSGNFAIAWATSSTITAQIFNTSGATAGSAVTVASVSGDTIACLGCAVGDFVVAYCAASGALYNLARVTSGAVAWTSSASATARPTAGPNDFQIPAGNRLAEMAGTSYLVWSAPSSSNAPNAFVYSSAGALQTTIGPAWADELVGGWGSICATPNGFAFVYLSTGAGTPPHIVFCDTSGNTWSDSYGSVALPVVPGGAATPTYFYMAWVGTGLAVVALAYSTVRDVCVTTLSIADEEGNKVAVAAYAGASPPLINNGASPPAPSYSGSITLAFGVQYSTAPVPIGGADGYLLVTAGNFFAGPDTPASSLVVYPFCCCRSSVLGVAQQGGAAGAQVEIYGTGSYAQQATQLFGAGAAFDQRGSPVPGCRGVVGSGLINLFGWV